VGSTFPDCPQFSVPTTKWDLVEYGLLSETEALPNSTRHPATPHIDMDRLVILLLEGKEVMPEMLEHLSQCRGCRHAIVSNVSEKLRRWHNTNLCETHNRLFREWRKAAEMYATNLAELIGKVGRVSVSQLFELAKITETVRRLTARVRTEQDEHMAAHNC
jgi:hypothetical protein